MNTVLLVLFFVGLIICAFGMIMSIYFANKGNNIMYIFLGIMWLGIISVDIIAIFI